MLVPLTVSVWRFNKHGQNTGVGGRDRCAVFVGILFSVRHFVHVSSNHILTMCILLLGTAICIQHSCRDYLFFFGTTSVNPTLIRSTTTTTIYFIAHSQNSAD